MIKTFIDKQNRSFLTISLMALFIFILTLLFVSLFQQSSWDRYNNSFIDESLDNNKTNEPLLSFVGESPEIRQEINQESNYQTQNFRYQVESENVRNTVAEIIDYVNNVSGLIINNRLNTENENITANLYISIPRENVETMQQVIDNTSDIKLFDQYGRDITEEYVDLERRLNQLEQTQVKLQEIYNQAVTANELLDVQRALIDNLEMIDNLKGRIESLERLAEMTYFAITIETEESALPIAERDSWEPINIIKDSVRDLVSSLQTSVNLLIRFIITVLPLFIIFILPILIFFYIINRKNSGNQSKKQQE